MLQFKKDCMNENHFENWYAAVLGIMGGCTHFTLLQINAIPSNYWVSLSKAGFTAFTCAFLGMLAKHLFKKIFKNKP
jgi:hypothetical protein